MFDTICVPSTRAYGAMAGAACAALFATVSPSLAATEYLGGGFIRVSDSCAEFGWTGVHQVMVRIEPQGSPGNSGTETQIALLLATGTIAFRVNLDRGVRFGYAPTQAVYVWNGPYAPEEPTTRLYFHINGDWPVNPGTALHRFSVQIENFNEHEGCIAWLNASLVRN